jgi:polysaccharide pyruvyl transferase WcaK-like protein
MDGNKVNVVGWYDKNNCGDESYKLAFPKVFPSYDFVFSDSPIKNADAYILGGGDIITEQALSTFQAINKPKHIMSVTVSKKFPSQLFEGFRTIITRDNASMNLLEQIGVSSLLYPDFSFSLNGNKENGKVLINKYFTKNRTEIYDKVVAVVINGNLIPEHGAAAYRQIRFERFCFDLSIAIDETPASFIFIPFGTKSPWDDRIANAMVASKCKWWKKNCIVFEEIGVQETLDIISACNATISSRLHSSIFSAATEVPFVDITHSHKNKYLLETMKYNKVSISYVDFSLSSMKSLLKTSLLSSSAEEIGSVVSMNKLLLRDLHKSIILT